MTIGTLGPRGLTVSVGIVGGLAALYARVPVPWMIGSLGACAVASRAGLPLAALPPVCERVARVAIGVSLGPSIAASVGAAHGRIGPVVVAALALTIATVALGTRWFERRLGLPRPAAYLTAMPGGLSMLLAMAGDIRQRPLVLVAHTVRVVMVVAFVSLLARGLGIPPVAAPLLSTLQLSNGTSWWLLGGLAAGFFAFCERVRIPGGHVIVTMIGTALLAGFTDLSIAPPEIVKTVAMLVFGVTLGMEVAAGPRDRYRTTFAAAALFTVVVMAAAGAVAEGLATWLGAPFLVLFLALAPGGIAEVSLVALALGLDAGLVALVHACRFLFIVVAGPVGLYLFDRTRR